MVHFLNVFIAKSLQNEPIDNSSKQDECTWYFLTFLIDLFPGIVILTFLIKLTDHIFKKLRFNSLITGNYIYQKYGIPVVSLKSYLL